MGRDGKPSGQGVGLVLFGDSGLPAEIGLDPLLQRLGGHLDMDSEPGATMLAAWLPVPGDPLHDGTGQDNLSGKSAPSPR